MVRWKGKQKDDVEQQVQIYYLQRLIWERTTLNTSTELVWMTRFFLRCSHCLYSFAVFVPSIQSECVWAICISIFILWINCVHSLLSLLLSSYRIRPRLLLLLLWLYNCVFESVVAVKLPCTHFCSMNSVLAAEICDAPFVLCMYCIHNGIAYRAPYVYLHFIAFWSSGIIPDCCVLPRKCKKSHSQPANQRVYKCVPTLLNANVYHAQSH